MKNQIVTVEYYNEDDKISSTLKTVDVTIQTVVEKFKLKQRQIQKLNKDGLLRLTFNKNQFILSII